MPWPMLKQPGCPEELTTGAIVGSTRYHDIVHAIDRVEIGYTWYAKAWQRSHVNTACKLLLLAHAGIVHRSPKGLGGSG